MTSGLYQFILTLFVFAMSLQLAFAQAPCGTQISDESAAFLQSNLSAVNKHIQERHLKSMPVIEFPVQIHIGQRSDGTGGVTAAQVDQMLIQLNSDFVDAGFEFSQCASINYINSDTYYDYDQTEENAVTGIHNVDGSINIYFFNTVKTESSGSLVDVCGYAYIPNGFDHIMVRNSCGLSGNTLAHEVGHYFGLLHTHDTRYEEEAITRNANDACYNCDTAGDQLCDTNADPNLFRLVNLAGCTYTGTATATCSGNTYTNPPVDNVMSYSSQSCATVFTPEQNSRMNYYATSGRSYLYCPSGNCAPPTNLTANNITGTSAQLSWTSAAGATADELRYRLQGYNWNYFTGAPANPINFTGLTTGNTYEFGIRSKCSDTDFSAWVDYSFIATATCVLPTAIDGSNITETSADLDWTNISGATYQVDYRPQGSSSWSTVNTSSPNISLTNLYAGTPYEFQITVQCSENPATTSVYNFTTNGIQICNPVGAATFNNITENSVDINWDAITGPITGYVLTYNQTGTSIGNTYTFSDNQFTLPELDAGTNYQINMRTTCTNSASPWSSAQYFSTDVGCIDLQLTAFLEGALIDAGNPSVYLNSMRTDLSTTLRILPGQTPVSQVSTPTPVGQPYNVAPWLYYGSEGASWSNNDYNIIKTQYGVKVVDWVLISLRTGTDETTTFKRVAALLMENGQVVFPDRCPLTGADPQSFYVVIEHRNHIGAMSAIPVTVSGKSASYDFTVQNSYAPSLNGQKEVKNGVWALFTGENDYSQNGYDINGADKSLWSNENGIFSVYTASDFNLNGDINGSDKSCWNVNNGIASGLKR